MDGELILRIVMWVGGLSFTGFVALTGWLFFGLRGAHSRIDTVEEKLKEAIQLEKDIKNIQENIKEMKDALIGSYDKKGLVIEVNDIDKRLQRIEAK